MPPPVTRLLNWHSATLMVTIASVVVPIYIWRADLSAKSLGLRVASQVALQPETASAMSGLQITIDGTVVVSPYLSVIELTNDGDKPIPPGEFEAPIELRLQPDTRVARARVTGSNPKDLEVHLTWDPQVVRVAPILLNPKDSVRISVLTAGQPPTFSPRVRIAGVAAVAIDDTRGKAMSWPVRFLWLCAGFLLFIVSDLTNEAITSARPLRLRRRSAILVSGTSGIAGAVMFMHFLDAMGVQELWQIVLSFIALTLVTLVSSAVLNGPERTRSAMGAESASRRDA